MLLDVSCSLNNVDVCFFFSALVQGKKKASLCSPSRIVFFHFFLWLFFVFFHNLVFRRVIILVSIPALA